MISLAIAMKRTSNLHLDVSSLIADGSGGAVAAVAAVVAVVAAVAVAAQ